LRGWFAREDGPAAGAPGDISVLAVLPFQNLSADAGEAYLASAVPMELTARLGRIGALKVVPWTFMKRFGELTPQSLKDIRQRTGADAVVEGSVLAMPGGTGDERPVQVRVQVYEASTGTQLWSSSFERSLSDFFPLQAEIAAEIANRVHVVLAAREQGLLSASRQVAAPAMEDYLRARQRLEGEMDLDGAIDLFQRAIRSAPDFAEAYVGLSSCYALQSAYFGHVPAPVATTRALDASNRAIELDARLPEGWAARAFVRFALEGNWAAAEADFTRAMELGPMSVDVLETYSTYLTDRGRHDEAIAISRQAEERAPFSAAASRQVAWAYYMARQFDNAIRQSRRTLEIEPGYVPARTVLARALLFTGRFTEGITELEALGRDYEHTLALGYAMAGRRDDAERLLNRILSSSYDRPVVAYAVALVYVALKDGAHAMDWLETAYRERQSSLTELSVDPMLDPIRSNEPFRAFVARVNEKQ
jgi:TolB-like protein